jgi:beta-lactamase superfamily II metal-dependent hydrolase
MAARDQAYQVAKPVILLSHWDVDHYHLLLEAEDATIKAFRRFIFRAHIPNQTSQRLYDRFTQLNPQALFPVDAESPGARRTSKKLKTIQVPGTPFKIYNGSEHYNRNVCGLMISFQTSKLVAVCAADFDYKQLQADVLKHFDYRHDHYLIVPHHGGNAGKVVYNLRAGTKKDAIISVGGINPYEHPFQYVIDKLEDMRFHVVNFKFRKVHYELPLS